MADIPQSRPDPGQSWDFPLKLALLEARIERIEHYLRFPAAAPSSATSSATSTTSPSTAVPPAPAPRTPTPPTPAAPPPAIPPAPRRPIHEILAEAAARHAGRAPGVTQQPSAAPGATQPSPATTPPATARPPRGPAFTLEWENLIGGKWALDVALLGAAAGKRR
jgi:uncharacterized membrane protein